MLAKVSDLESMMPTTCPFAENGAAGVAGIDVDLQGDHLLGDDLLVVDVASLAFEFALHVAHRAGARAVQGKANDLDFGVIGG